MAEIALRRCTRCIMDTTDTAIEFDENGVCSNCRNYERAVALYGVPVETRKEALKSLVEEIKREGRHKEYDCVIGVSGGVDSTYVAYLVKKFGLRPLAVHMDNGWDSELAVSNIEKVLKKLDIDLLTRVLDWEEFKNLQVSFLKASVVDPEIPTDHAIRATLTHEAAHRNIQYVIYGTNLATEQIMPKSWKYGWDDWRFIRGLQKRFGKARLKTYPHISYPDLIYLFTLRRIKEVSILDYIDYNKEKALQILQDELDWRPYGGKHYESIYTRFSQGYIIYRKFNIDKRKAHLSTLIMSGQITREDALEQMKDPPYAGYMFEDDMEYVIKKLGLSEAEFQKIMETPLVQHTQYPNNEKIMKTIKRLQLPALARKLGLLPKRS